MGRVGRVVGRIENGPLNGRYVSVGDNNNGASSASGKDKSRR